jgi:hypothetical protein
LEYREVESSTSENDVENTYLLHHSKDCNLPVVSVKKLLATLQATNKFSQWADL